MRKLASYFAVRLGAFLLWKNVDKAHVWIALHQDEKQERLEREAEGRRAREEVIGQARCYIHSHTCCTKLRNSFRYPAAAAAGVVVPAPACFREGNQCADSLARLAGRLHPGLFILHELL